MNQPRPSQQEADPREHVRERMREGVTMALTLGVLWVKNLVHH